MNISYRELTEEAYAKRNKRIKELEDRQKYLLDDTGAFKGAKLWMHELKELEESIEKGMSSDWFYGTNKYLYEKKSK